MMCLCSFLVCAYPFMMFYKRNYILEMEIYDKNLWDHFESDNKIERPQRYKMFTKIWNGLHEIQNHDLVHLDLKLSNIDKFGYHG